MLHQGKQLPRNAKRIEELVHKIPLLSGDSLFKLISSIFFYTGNKSKAKKALLTSKDPNNKDKKDFIDVSIKVKLRVLMAIGPKSGL